jgi:hypothetical protein
VTANSRGSGLKPQKSTAGIHYRDGEMAVIQELLNQLLIRDGLYQQPWREVH